MIGRLKKFFSRQWRVRQKYRSTWDWLISIYNRMILARPSFPWSGKGRVKRVRLNAVDGDLFVRLGTSDWYVLDEIFLEEEYAPLLEHGVRDVRTVIDLGANVGFSVRLWQRAFPEARVIAVEPDEDNVALAQRNIDSNRAMQTSMIRACAAGSSRMVSLDRSGLQWGFRMQEGTSGQQTVEALTVPQLLERYSVTGEIDLLKCDVEGAEAEIFSNCADWISRVRHMIVELHEPYTLEKFYDDLKRSGTEFEPYQVLDKGGQKTVYLERKSS